MNRPPNKLERLNCYTARDSYFQCLDTNHQLLDGIKFNTEQELLNPKVNCKKLCTSLRNVMVKQCPASWVEHFEQLRVEEKQKEYFVNKMEKLEPSDEFFRQASAQPNDLKSSA